MVQTQQKTACSFTPTVTSNSIARVYTWRNRVPQKALERLELLDAKVSRAVLRGRDGGNTILLPDTDLKDAEWLADLLQCGLLQSSYVSLVEQQDLRDLTRLRSSLVQDRARLVNRVLKTLETAGIKLRPVLSDIMGASGQAILGALAAGERDPHRLAGLAHWSLQRKHDQLVAALQGGLQPHHNFLLRELLTDFGALERSIAHVELEISARLRPFEQTLERLEHITGVGQHTLESLFAEVGWDMDPFPDAAHLARLCRHVSWSA